MGDTNIARLPDEMLLEVFRYLAAPDVVACAHVCERWLGITHSVCLWKNFEYKEKGDDRLKDAFVITKLARGFHRLTLELSHSTSISISPGEIFLSLSSLAWLAFKPMLVDIVERLSPHLTELTVSGVSQLEHHLKLLKKLLLMGPFSNLRSFRALAPCGVVVDDSALELLCCHCPLLETLVLEGCHTEQLTVQGGLSHLHRLKNLKTLHLDRKLSFCDFSDMVACLNGRLCRPQAEVQCTCKAHDISFLEHCQQLTSLQLSPCNEFICALPELRSLTLKCDDVQAVGDRLDLTIRALPKLRTLSLYGQWWVGLEHLQKIRAVTPITFCYKSELSSTGSVFVIIKLRR